MSQTPASQLTPEEKEAARLAKAMNRVPGQVGVKPPQPRTPGPATGQPKEAKANNKAVGSKDDGSVPSWQQRLAEKKEREKQMEEEERKKREDKAHHTVGRTAEDERLAQSMVEMPTKRAVSARPLFKRDTATAASDESENWLQVRQKLLHTKSSDDNQKEGGDNGEDGTKKQHAAEIQKLVDDFKKKEDDLKHQIEEVKKSAREAPAPTPATPAPQAEGKIRLPSRHSLFLMIF